MDVYKELATLEEDINNKIIELQLLEVRLSQLRMLKKSLDEIDSNPDVKKVFEDKLKVSKPADVIVAKK